MTVRYITVTPITNLFVPATRSFGDIAIVRALDTTAQGPKKTPVPITSPLAVSSSDVSLTTNAATPAANSTLHFAAVPAAVVPGPADHRCHHRNGDPARRSRPVENRHDGRNEPVSVVRFFETQSGLN